MATDGPTPAPCKDEIYLHGKTVIVIGSISSNRMENWCKEVGDKSGVPCDWHYVGGRAVLKTLGDPDYVKRKIYECTGRKFSNSLLSQVLDNVPLAWYNNDTDKLESIDCPEWLFDYQLGRFDGDTN